MEMTIDRMVELLEIEHTCMLRGAHDDCDRNCADCELVQDDNELHEMYTNVIALLKEQEAEISKISNAYLDLVGKASKQPDYMPKKGSWIRHGEPPEYVIECSRCGQKYFCHAMQTLANYCSMCGAKMESWIVENQAEMT